MDNHDGMRWQLCSMGAGVCPGSAREEAEDCRESARTRAVGRDCSSVTLGSQVGLGRRELFVVQDKALALRVPSRCVLAGELMVHYEQPRRAKMATLLRTLFEREGSPLDVMLPLFPDFCRCRHEQVANAQPHGCLRPIPVQQTWEAVPVHAAPPLRYRLATSLWASPSAM